MLRVLVYAMTDPIDAGVVVILILTVPFFLLHGAYAFIQDLRGVRAWWNRSQVVVISYTVWAIVLFGLVAIPLVWLVGSISIRLGLF